MYVIQDYQQPLGSATEPSADNDWELAQSSVLSLMCC